MGIKGLTSSEVLENHKKYGLNVLERKRKITILIRLLKKASNPLILLLLFSSILSAFLGEKHDFLIILTILLISIVLDVYQEHQAQNAADKLSKKITLKTTVIRDNQKQEIHTHDITIGDIVLLSSGNMIPADCKLLETQNLMINQSVLTGESFPQEKSVNDFIFMGTYVVSGSAVAIVISIGHSTEMGKIASHLNEPRPLTEFEKGLNNFSLMLVRITFILSLILLIINFLLGHHFITSLIFVLALAIGFAPELLPMILTINLSKGAIRLASKGVIIKFLPSIENFGSMDVFCTDKTGTLTQGKIFLESNLNINGKNDETVVYQAFLNSFYQSSYKNPIDDAILQKKIKITASYRKVGEIPYDFYRRRSTVILKKQKSILMVTKGAPESVLPLCSNRNEVKVNLKEFHQQGLRVIAVAVKEPELKNKYTQNDEVKMKCIGILVFSDPPKIGVSETIKKLEQLGVNLKILTGDNELVTQFICKQVGIKVQGILTGEKMEKINDEALSKLVENTTIFARLNPDSKVRIISILKQKGHVVGYLGDGINDAPALKSADVGISVDNAVDVAKESADLILLHKDLEVLQLGIQEGRTTFANIMKYISMGTSSTFGNMISLAITSVVLPFLPILPVQLLLNDLLYDFSQILLVKDRVDQELIQKPYRWNINFIKKFMLIFGVISSIFDLATFYILFYFLKATPTIFQTGWFMESFVSQTIIIFSIRTVLVPFYKSKISPIFALGILILIGFSLWLPFSFLSSYFHFVTPPYIFFIFLAIAIPSYFLLIEITKFYFYKSHSYKIQIC